MPPGVEAGRGRFPLSLTFSTSFAGGVPNPNGYLPDPETLARIAHRKVEELGVALRTFRNAVPDAKGVVLATPDGIPIAYDLPLGDTAEDAAARAAAAHLRNTAELRAKGRDAPASAFVDGDEGRVLVVFVDGGFLRGEDPEEDPEDEAAGDWSMGGAGGSF